MFVKKLVTKGIASGVGMATEAYAERKERKAGRSPSPNPLSASPSHEYQHVIPKDHKEYDEAESSSSEDDVELAWELDEAAAQLEGPPPAYDDAVTLSPTNVAQSFLQNRAITGSNLAPIEYKPLSMPVILPQRRPRNKTRGFVRAYPPILEQCAGIDQQMFMDFLDSFDKASKASPVYDVINMACFAVGFVNPIASGVAIAVQVATNTAREVHTRYKRNHFLDEINETWLKPKGLYALIMTFKPDAPAVVGMDVTSTDQALAKASSEPDSEWRKKLMNIRLTSGTTKGEAALPEAAPLIYPAIDAAAASESAERQSFLKSSGAFMNTYLDRRAHALYATTNTDSKLVMPASERQFKSKYADPNHPIHSGTIAGLLTAGKFDPIRSKRARKAQRRAQRQGIVLTEEELRNAEMGRKLAPERGGRRTGKGPIGLVLTPVRKALKPNVLYLTIVNMPSESEMVEIRQELERAQTR